MKSMKRINIMMKYQTCWMLYCEREEERERVSNALWCWLSERARRAAAAEARSAAARERKADVCASAP